MISLRSKEKVERMLQVDTYTEFLAKNKLFYHLKTLYAFKKVDLQCILHSFTQPFRHNI